MYPTQSAQVGSSTMTPPDAVAIEQQLTHDIAACEALLQLMQTEREALANRDVENLGKAIAEKATHLQQLEQSAAQRALWARHAHQANAESGWNQMLEDLRQPALTQQWEALKQLVSQCREQNEVNGRLLARSQHTFGRLLNIMRGQNEAPSLYSPKGNKTGGNTSHTFGEA